MRKTTIRKAALGTAFVAFTISACGTPAVTEDITPVVVGPAGATVEVARFNQVAASQALRAQARVVNVEQVRALQTVEAYALRHAAQQARIAVIEQLRAQQTVEAYALRHAAQQARIAAIEQLRAQQTVQAYALRHGAQQARIAEIEQLRAQQAVEEWESRYSASS